MIRHASGAEGAIAKRKTRTKSARRQPTLYTLIVYAVPVSSVAEENTALPPEMNGVVIYLNASL